MSQTSLSAASASSPGLAYGTYLTGTPRRSAIARAMSGETPCGSPDAVLPVTSRKLLMLIPARRTPVGASSATIWLTIDPPILPARRCRPGAGSPSGEPSPQSTVITGLHRSVKSHLACEYEYLVS